jgi:hypothetical protein
LVRIRIKTVQAILGRIPPESTARDAHRQRSLRMLSTDSLL